MSSIIRKLVVGITVFSGLMIVQATELSIWQIPTAKGKTPVFYQEASKSSKVVPSFKPDQVVMILSKKKDWFKVGAMDNSGETAWFFSSDVLSTTSLKIDLKQTNDHYHCQVSVRDPKGRHIGKWYTAHRAISALDGERNIDTSQLIEDTEFEKALVQFEKTFIEQRNAMLNMMDRMLSGAAKEMNELTKTIDDPKQSDQKTKK